MSRLSRRKLITAGIAGATGFSSLAAAAKIADRYGLIPPDGGGLYGPGQSLTYASQRLLTRHTLAREFSRSQISAKPFANGAAPQSDEFLRSQERGFADWRFTIDGMVSNPGSLSLADLQSYPPRSQITQVICEEGWNFIAEWTGVPLSHVLQLAGILPQAKYVVYFSVERYWVDSIDMADALHPQTILTYAMNGAPLPIGHGAPLRMRLPRQLGYKSVKYLNRLTVTDSLKDYSPESDYSWYAGI